MIFDPTILAHASYVAFAFAVLFFGALAYRQVLDNLEVRRLALGEDRRMFHNAPATLAMILYAVVVAIVGWAAFSTSNPTVYRYSLPLIVGAQWVQISLRILLQPTMVKTGGIVLRPLLLGPNRGIRYVNIISVSFHRKLLWTEVTIFEATRGPATFRIFRFSDSTLELLLRSSTTAVLLRVDPQR